MNRINSDNYQKLETVLQKRILLLDGGMGTMIQRYKLDEQGYRGDRFKNYQKDLRGNNDLLVLSQPQIVKEIHEAYLLSGSDIIETNTFNANPISQSDYGLEALTYEINFNAAKIVKEVCNTFSAKNPQKPRFAAGKSAIKTKVLGLAEAL